MLWKVLLLSTCLAIIHSGDAQMPNEDVAREVVVLQADEQLLKYGYAQPSEIGELMNEESDTFKKDIRAYQNFAGIEETGKLDEPTIHQMHKKRCGDRDVSDKKSRFRRYTLEGTKWKKPMNLRWKLVNHGDDLSRETVLKVMHRAFQLWSDVTNIKFIEAKSNNPEPEILVKFGRGKHGDPYAFDGRGNTLAHAFYPHNNKGLGGDCHFDDDEVFSAFEKPPKGKIDLLWVAVHEIGHSLGLKHSTVKNSIMFPYYPDNSGWTDNLKLRRDDVNGIQAIYGSKPSKWGPRAGKHNYCGGDLKDKWSVMCGKSRDEVAENVLTSSNEAKRFLKHSRKRRAVDWENLAEECCEEKCDDHEIVETCND